MKRRRLNGVLRSVAEERLRGDVPDHAGCAVQRLPGLLRAVEPDRCRWVILSYRMKQHGRRRLTARDISDSQVPETRAVSDGGEARVEPILEGFTRSRERRLGDGVVRGDELEGDDRVRLGDVDELGVELEAARADLDLGDAVVRTSNLVGGRRCDLRQWGPGPRQQWQARRQRRQL